MSSFLSSIACRLDFTAALLLGSQRVLQTLRSLLPPALECADGALALTANITVNTCSLSLISHRPQPARTKSPSGQTISDVHFYVSGRHWY